MLYSCCLWLNQATLQQPVSATVAAMVATMVAAVISLRIHRVADDFETRITYINKTLYSYTLANFTKYDVCVRCFVIIVI